MALQTQSYASYFEATFPDPAFVVNTQPDYTDGVNIYSPSYDPGAGGTIPAASDVRLGTAVGQTTGTLAVPDPGEVLSGVATDDTLGTYVVVAAADVRLNVTFGAGSIETGSLAVPAPGEVLAGVATDNTVGTYVVVAAADVRLDTTFGAASAETGLLDLPSINDVRLATQFDQTTKTGNVRLPEVGDVRAGTQYDTNDSLTGQLDVTGDPPVYPPEADVRLGITFGTQSNPTLYTGNVRVPPVEKVEKDYQYDTLDSLTGTLVTGTVPAVEDVRFGVAYGEGDAQQGVLESPLPATVLLGVGYGAYGTEFEGTLVDVPGGTASPLSPVLASGALRSPLIIGNAYTGDFAFQWQISPVSGYNQTSTVRFKGWDACDCETLIWDIEGVISSNATSWDLVFEMTPAESALIPAGEYNWAVEIEDLRITGSHEHLPATWVC